MQALSKYILLRVKPPKEKTRAGIVIPEEKTNYFTGIVESVGVDIKEDLVGKTILFSPNKMHISIKDEEDVLCIIHGDNALLLK